MSTLRIVLVPLLALLLLPAASGATTTVSLSGATVQVTGGPEVNDLTVGVLLPDLSDPNGIVAGAGCTQVSATKATCTYDWQVIEMHLGDGADRVTAGALSPRSAVVHGDGGDDDLGVGSMDDRLYGDDGDDKLSAGGGDDQVEGGAGNDTIKAGGGNDRVDGGAGMDDVSGDGLIGAEDGNDVIAVRDGESDAVQCGLGADRVTADALDVVDRPDCESVDIGTVVTPPGPGTTPVTPVMDVELGTRGSMKLRTLADRGVRLACTFLAQGSMTARLVVSATEARKLGLRRKTVLATLTAPVRADDYSITLQPRAAYRSRLRRLRRSIRMTFEVSARTTDGSSTDRDSTALTFVR